MGGQQIGYARVSTTLDQNEKRQLEGKILDRVFTDKASGRETSRPELTELLRCPGRDTVVVHSMDRLARNLDDLRALVQTLTSKGVRVEFVKERLVFTGGGLPDDQPHALGDGCLRGVRTLPDPGAAAGRHRPGPAARRLLTLCTVT